MKLSSSTMRSVLLGLYTAATAPSLLANQTPTDVAREKIIIFSRQGDAPLQQAISQLDALYQRTNDRKVRDDLIALYLRSGQSAKALQVCPECSPSQLSESELENLGKAARNEKQFERSYALYEQLAKKFPNNQNGWLGTALVATELKRYPAAKNALANYKKRFGQNGGFKDAQNYFLDASEADMAKLGRWQSMLEKDPKNADLVRNLYRLASKYNMRPLQEKLMREHGDLFNTKDKLWLEHDGAIVSAKIAQNNRELNNSFERLGALLGNLTQDNPLYPQTLADHFALGVRLGKLKDVRKDYEELQKQANPPAYLEEAFADYWAQKGSPHEALKRYQAIEQKLLDKKQKPSDGLLFKLASSASDAGKFPLAQHYLEQVSNNSSINDYTHTTRITNPSYDTRYFGLARLALWRGNASLAQQMVDKRALEQTPGDPWILMQKAELERSRNNFDDAEYWLNRAAVFFTEPDQKEIRYAKTELALAKNDLPTASRLVSGFTEDERMEAKSLIDNYELAHSGRIIGAVGIQHRTSAPTKQGNESSQNYAIYSPKTADGHDVYVRYGETRSPVSEETLTARFVGAGTELNFYPFNLNLEAGKGIHLNKRGYALANLDYELNQHWDFSLSGHYNGVNVPARAAAQDVYTRGGGFSAAYTYSDVLRAGAGAYLTRFTDGNLRRDLNFWLNTQTFKHDRWALTNSFRIDHTKNKLIDTANYYNPSKALGLDFGADLSYYQPLDHRLILTHHLKGNLGSYKQQDLPRERTWSVSYGNEWRIGKKYGVSYEFGRKKNIYDGAAEYNNFGNLNFSLYY